MDVRKEFNLLTTLLSVVFMIIGVSLIMGAGTLAKADFQTAVFILSFFIGVFYLKEGIFSFIDDIRVILEGKKE